MATAKKIGIWMDHSNAHLMEFTTDPITTTTITDNFSHQDKENSLGRSENQMHNREQHEQAAYFNKLTEVIKKYDEIILFGPTNAKSELLNIINRDHRFANIKIAVKQTDKMTTNQQHAFVKKHFSK
jgi:stalled ribosome rescue protein Dom34